MFGMSLGDMGQPSAVMVVVDDPAPAPVGNLQTESGAGLITETSQPLGI